MTLVLISGSADRVTPVADALTSAGVETVTGTDLHDALAALGDRRLDAYVQLPVEITSEASTAVGRVRDLLRDGLVRRFEAADAVVPAIADGGAVVLVAGNFPSDPGLADDHAARSSLLRVLAHAVLADRPGGGIRAVVLPGDTSAADVANHVLGRPTERDEAIAHFVEENASESYADWRVDLLSMATHES